MSKRDREIEERIIEAPIGDLELINRSPDAKKGKREVERMVTWKDRSDDKELISVTIVLNELVSKSKDDKVKSLIDCYNPLIREETDLLRKHLITCCECWDNKEESIREAIRFVWPEIDLEIDSIDDLGKLADILLLSIETLMPKHCKECEEYYIVNRTNKPIIRCMWCRGGAHDCIDRGNKEKLRGMTWLCRTCNDVINNQILTKIDLVKKMELIKKEIDINFEGFESEKKIDTEEAFKVDNSKDESLDGNKKEPVNNRRNSTQESRRRKDENENKDEKNARVEENNARKICWFYANRKCKYGSQCRNEHPEACQQMLEHGKCIDSRCKLVHPKICRALYNQGICERFNCWYTHPTKIENRNQNRPVPNNIPQSNMHSNNNNPQNSNNNSFYQNQPPQSSYQNNNTNFLGNWPTPAEMSSMNMQQTISRLIGTLEKVDARVGNMEMRQMNRWMY